jgi:cytochrome c553
MANRNFPSLFLWLIMALSNAISSKTPPLKLCVLLALFISALLHCWRSDTAADETPSRAPALANACATCHGPNGQSQGAIPSINALTKENFVAAMRAFQTGERQGTVMNRIAKGLEDADIESVAAYLAVKP